MALQQSKTHEPVLTHTGFVRFTEPSPKTHTLKNHYALTFHLRGIIHPEKLDLSKSLNLAEAWLYEYNIATYGELENHAKRGKEEVLRRIYHFIYTTDVLMRTGNLTTDKMPNPKVCIIDDTSLGWLDEVHFVSGVELPDVETICDIFHKANIRANHMDPNIM